MRTSRRGLLAAFAAVGLAPRATWADVGSPAYLAAAGLPDGRFVLLGLGEDGAERFRIDLPARGHAAAARPRLAEAVAFGRRPGRYALVLDCADGRVVAELSAPAGRAFQGHGAFSRDGATLFTTETAEEGRGLLGVWDAASGYARIGEVSSGGIGPHEILLTRDGARLAVANGGIATDTDVRSPLNLATMHANLSYLDVATGRVLETLETPDELRLNSIRHIAIARDGTLAAALQWEGDELMNPPLLAVHRPGAAALEFLSAAPETQRRTRNYAGSAAISDDARQAAITCPRGGMMLVFDLATGAATELDSPDLCGVAAAQGRFVCTTGEGLFLDAAVAGGRRAFSGLAFDNHIVRLA
ncbi:DUF1513 domain-containing protein [Amaricoccus sp.]|uniref:DUF1513 domain-containing protein n=1 Tax=Amaricoccus sp. TaxID=1872485 RepID=UPI001B7B623A|nr:DUF1513 domain-containing protein [Amaricoccus sp.]MBP7001305.1 DUF1513 domain-containing protein [Amaricoccus sp.]